MMKAVAWNREDAAEVLILSDVTPEGNNHNKISTSSGTGGGLGTIVNCQTQHRHFYLSSPQQIRTGNTVLCSPINKAVVADCTCTEQPIVVLCLIFLLFGVFVLRGDQTMRFFEGKI